MSGLPSGWWILPGLALGIAGWTVLAAVVDLILRSLS